MSTKNTTPEFPQNYNSKQIAEEKAKVGYQMKTMAENLKKESRDFSSEEKEQWESLNTEFDRLSTEFNIQNRVERATACVEDCRSPAPMVDVIKRGSSVRVNSRNVEKLQNRAMQAWIKRDNWHGEKITFRDEDNALLDQFGLQDKNEMRIGLMEDAPESRQQINEWGKEQRDMNIATSTAGGSLVPTSFAPRLEQALLAYFPAMQAFDVMRTPDGRSLPLPTIIDVTNTGHSAGEGGAFSITETDPTTGVVTFGAYKRNSDIIKISQETIEDNFLADALIPRLASMLGERLARQLAADATTGTGSSQPKGVVTCSAAGATSASPTAISLTDIFNLNSSLEPSYVGEAEYMGHNSTLWYLRSLTETTGRSLFWSAADSLSGKLGNTLNGVRFWVNQQMTGMNNFAPIANAKHLLYGNFKKMVIRMVNDIRFYTLDQLFRQTDQVGITAFIRYDVNILDAGTHPIVRLTQHS